MRKTWACREPHSFYFFRISLESSFSPSLYIPTRVYKTRRRETNTENNCITLMFIVMAHNKFTVFRRVRQKRVSLTGSVRPSVRPVLKSHFSTLFNHRDVTHKMKSSHALSLAPSLALTLVLSLFLPQICWSHRRHHRHREIRSTQWHSPDAALPGRAF